jgi:hypothetical protein
MKSGKLLAVTVFVLQTLFVPRIFAQSNPNEEQGTVGVTVTCVADLSDGTVTDLARDRNMREGNGIRLFLAVATSTYGEHK